MRFLRFLPLLLILAPSAAYGTPEAKTTICHWANGNAHEITISVNALPGHFDGETGKPVPGHEADTKGTCPIPPVPPVTTTTTPEAPIAPVSPLPPVSGGTPGTLPNGPKLPVPSDSGRSDPIGTNCLDGAGYPFVTSYAECPSGLTSPDPGQSAPGVPNRPSEGELPRTGGGVANLAKLALLLITAGLALGALAVTFRPNRRLPSVRDDGV